MSLDPFNSTTSSVFLRLTTLNLQFIATKYGLVPGKYTSTRDAFALLNDLSGRGFLTRDPGSISQFMQVLYDAEASGAAEEFRKFVPTFKPVQCLPPPVPETVAAASPVPEIAETTTKNPAPIRLSEIEIQKKIIAELENKLSSINAENAAKLENAVRQTNDACSYEIRKSKQECEEAVKTIERRYVYQVSDLEGKLALATRQLEDLSNQLRQLRSSQCAQPQSVQKVQAVSTTAARTTFGAVDYTKIPGFYLMLDKIVKMLDYHQMQSILFIKSRAMSHNPREDVMLLFRDGSMESDLFGDARLSGLKELLENAGCIKLYTDYAEPWLRDSRLSGYF